MKIFVKYMVSLRCKIIVKEQLKSLGFIPIKVSLGTAEILENLTKQQFEQLKRNLEPYGLELLDDKKKILIEKIQSAIVELIHYTDEIPKVNYSEYLSSILKLDYNYISNTFSEVKGITIQQYIILHKIERVKELLLYDELTLTEIAFKLNYSSVGHLSNQFKKITGLTPSYYKKIGERRKSNLENL